MVARTKIIFLLLGLLGMSLACSQDGLVAVDESSVQESANANARASTQNQEEFPGLPQPGSDTSESLESEDSIDSEEQGGPEASKKLSDLGIKIGSSEYTSTETVELFLTGEGALEMYVTNEPECLDGGEWEAFAESKDWTLAQSNALATVFVKFKSSAGEESDCINDTINHDNTAPANSAISINSDAEYTNDLLVTLNISADDAQEMLITEVEGCESGGVWEPFADLKDWTLQQANTVATVFVKFKDAIGNETTCEFDSIIHDDQAPSGAGLTINGDAAETDLTQVSLNLSAEEASEMYVTNTDGCEMGGSWEPFAETKDWMLIPSEQLPTATVYVKYRDAVGNETPCINDSIGFNANLDCSGLSGSWVLVPGDPDYGTRDFCIMKYEAKDVNNTATSQWQLEPWVNLSQNEAKAKCSELGQGYRLVSNEQWMTAAANIAGNSANWIDPNNSNQDGVVGVGLLVEGHSDDNPNSACEAAENDLDRHVRSGSCTGDSSGNVDQRRTHQVVNGENLDTVWDLAGNVEEWVDFYDPNKPIADPASNEIYLVDDSASDLKLNFLIPTSKGFWGATWGSDEGVGRFFAGDPNVGGAMFRGGSWDENRDSGIFEVNLNLGPDDASTEVGFRCVYGP